MKRQWTIFVIMFLLCSPIMAQTLDEIIAKNLTARGGVEKMRSVKSYSMKGKLTGPGVNLQIMVRMESPKMFRMDMNLATQGTLTEAFNGNMSMGWKAMTSASGTSVSPERLDGEALKNVQDQAEMISPLLDYAAKGHRVELVGKESVAGKLCHKLKITLNTGRIMFQYIDAQSFLEIWEEIIRGAGSTEMVIEETVGAYKKFGGILFPCEFDSNVKGSPQHYLLKIESYELNVKTDSTAFEMPAPTK